ncbi:MAG TPA: phosphoribosylformylglycinamidine synthase, partial [Ruminococcaceae bacterium]|nr:phosphoribosylformylglycinamidine synthase [Oscillospiraceae bacterium]
MNVYRIFVEKRQEFSVEAANILTDLRTAFQIDGLSRLRILNRYDVEGITEKTFEKAKTTIFSEPQVDMLYSKMDPLEDDEYAFAMEYLPGQFDQRADSCAQCIALLTQTEKPTVRTAKIFILSGKISDQDFKKVKAYLINPVESREASFEIPETLEEKYPNPGKVKILKNFGVLTREQQTEFAKQFGLAMDVDDIAFCQQYFRDEEKREPTMTELRVIDTYWSDHCRHTTFQTELDNVEIIPDYIQKTWKRYRDCRAKLYKKQNKPITLMDIATMGAKKLKADGDLSELDESEEINACSVKIRADIDGKEEDWLLMFKNETHNHPTEIEPFGGAATCLGGAIRDPLSGRSYVYQAMRVTGAADPRVSVDKTLKGKLPQRKITVGAASGYSSYGNQIGLATGQVTELYHSGYAAKRLETGAVVGATPAANVVRERPAPGDIVILLGGRTGRDGMGGATGSSKSHTTSSLSTCGAEVQKGNPPEERKIQRLFRDPEVTHMIKRCNDFGAGGISVAIGELADGLKIDLNAVPRKYAGLDGTELAISESQERMAVVVATKDVERFIEKAQNENVEATAVAEVSSSPRLRMYWEGSCIVNISRKFLDSNGAPKHASARIDDVDISKLYTSVSESDLRQRWKSLLEDLNICSQKGLGDRFDSTIGSATVLLPYGGMNQLTPTQAMAAKLLVLNGETSTCSLMAFGCNPHIADISPYHAGTIAVVESVARIIASGGSLKNTWLSFQEFFEKLRQEPLRWGKPLSALLGALEAQLGLGIAAIGGKDSMSGSFESLDVPSTIISFACG